MVPSWFPLFSLFPHHGLDWVRRGVTDCDYSTVTSHDPMSVSAPGGERQTTHSTHSIHSMKVRSRKTRHVVPVIEEGVS